MYTRIPRLKRGRPRGSNNDNSLVKSLSGETRTRKEQSDIVNNVAQFVNGLAPNDGAEVNPELTENDFMTVLRLMAFANPVSFRHHTQATLSLRSLDHDSANS